MPPDNSNSEATSLLKPFCQAIAIYEGADVVGARPYRNGNPGDLRWPYGAPYPWGATGVDGGEFLIFPDCATGFAALEAMVTRAAKGQSRVYKPSMTLVEFFDVYAPSSDSNNPNAYASWVAERIGVDAATFTINKLL